jgi:hypothetical protein
VKENRSRLCASALLFDTIDSETANPQRPQKGQAVDAKRPIVSVNLEACKAASPNAAAEERTKTQK